MTDVDVSKSIQLRDLPRSDPGWAGALPVLRRLRTHLTQELLDQILREGEPQGLRFVAAFDGGVCVGVAGWRIIANTGGIRILHIDDLVIDDAARGRRVGSALLAELGKRGTAAGCRTLELDSGVQRYGAHRFYLRERMSITAHHLSLDLSGDG